MTRSILLIGGTGTISTSIMEALRKDKNYRVSVINRGIENLHRTLNKLFSGNN